MKYISWNKFKDKITAFITTKEIGNMAFQVDDGKDVLSHRETVSKDINIPSSSFTYVHQHHSDIILEVKKEDIGKGTKCFEDGLECDALYTKLRNVPLCIFHADCVPLFFYIPKKEIVGVIHSGYKGTLKEMTYKSIKYIIEKENVDPNDIYVYIGPSRKFFSFIISEEDTKEIINLGYEKSIKLTKGQYFFDMPFMNYLMLTKLGINPKNIEVCDIDTYDNPLLYSAYAKDNGRLASIICLK